MGSARKNETALSVAFSESGWESPYDTQRAALLDLAIEAWDEYPDKRDGGARQSHVKDTLKNDLTYAALLWLKPSAIGEVLSLLLAKGCEAVEDRRQSGGAGQGTADARWEDARPTAQPIRYAGTAPVGGGQAPSGTHIPYAPANPSRDDALPRGVRRSEPAISAPTPTLPVPAAPNLKELADKQAARSAARLKVEIRLSKLDTVLIYGKPIGDCTVSTVREWASVREKEMREAGRDARFALALVANLPGNAVIRDWWKNGDEIDKIYQRAENSYAA